MFYLTFDPKSLSLNWFILILFNDGIGQSNRSYGEAIKDFNRFLVSPLVLNRLLIKEMIID